METDSGVSDHTLTLILFVVPSDYHFNMMKLES